MRARASNLHRNVFIPSVPDGAHTLTCALMLLNTDLHGHVWTACTKFSLCCVGRIHHVVSIDLSSVTSYR